MGAAADHLTYELSEHGIQYGGGNVGLSLNVSDTYIRCYLGDIGLLVSHAFDENELLEDEVYKQILSVFLYPL